MENIKNIKLNNFEIGNGKLTILAGPCAIESQEILDVTACKLKEITQKLGINYIFKSSFDKANRSSLTSYRGPGITKGLEMLAKVKEKYSLPIVTDIHTPDQAAIAAEVADIIQIPAFLCRQTDLLVAAAKTGKIINIKKGQFLAPEQMGPLVKKVEDSGNHNILLTDRGTSFGYNNLVVDFRGIPIMQSFGYPIVFDATHSVQLPGANGTCSGGDRRFVPLLAKAAMAAGAEALFFEVHPEPDKALCDGANMIALDKAEELFSMCKKIHDLVRN
ncbi:MAG: 3-deoxy-8-phosphooctulonate synthase [Clostridiaceae bacterium]|jgi:2-dehydro-3-deoxyphosphooctonate aldolase (KDO 8-P synthase)|nr:3-deoxy-8-phosphooctulonate synthase [Clostridiaceae bacterium]